LVQKLVNWEHRHPKADLSRIGIGERQRMILGILQDNAGITQKELTTNLRISSSSMGELLGKLEQNGYLLRQSNISDKRTFNISLTDKGREVVESYKEIRSAATQEWCSGLPDCEQEELIRLLEKLNSSMEKQLADNTERANKRSI
jgi:DNA-binding MarR family transcriptional regulator